MFSFYMFFFYLRIKLIRFCDSFRKRNKSNFEPNKTTVIIIIMIPLGQRARITMFLQCLASRKHLLNSIGHQLVLIQVHNITKKKSNMKKKTIKWIHRYFKLLVLFLKSILVFIFFQPFV